MERKIIQPGDAFSSAVASEALIQVAGKLPYDSTTGKIVVPEIEDKIEDIAYKQAKACLSNIAIALKEAGSSMEEVTKTCLYVVMDKVPLRCLASINKAYKEAFPGEKKPARSGVFVAGLFVEGAFIEIDAVAERL